MISDRDRNEIDAFLDANATAAKWPTVGFVVEGTVIGASMADQTDYDSGERLYWIGSSKVEESKTDDHSSPVRQLLLNLQCEPTGETWEGLQNTRIELPNDDGQRTAYCKGALQAAVKEALRKARARVEEGAYIRIERIADGVQKNPKFASPHNFRAEWTPAAKNPVEMNKLMGSEPAKGDDPWA